MKNNKIKILWWIIALLAILNITTIATIVVHNYNENKKTDTEASIIVEPGTQPINGRYFRHELGFDDNQMEVFRQSHRAFHQQANHIIASIHLQKELMFKELQTENPDTAKLNMISKEIGLLHTQLKEETVKFYMSLAKVCSIEQKEKMKEIFTPLFINLPISHNENECKCANPNNNKSNN